MRAVGQIQPHMDAGANPQFLQTTGRAGDQRVEFAVGKLVAKEVDCRIIGELGDGRVQQRRNGLRGIGKLPIHVRRIRLQPAQFGVHSMLSIVCPGGFGAGRFLFSQP